MTEAFVYCWTDHPQNMKYIGFHKGTPNDGYISSSKKLNVEYEKRPNDFTRKILRTGPKKDMYIFETWLLKTVNARENPEYYNEHNNIEPFFVAHNERTKEKLSELARKQWATPTMRAKLIAIAKRRCEDPTERKRLGAQTKKFWESPIYREARTIRNRVAGHSISRAKKGIPLTESHKKALRVPKRIPVWNKGKSLSPLTSQHKEKQRISMTGHKFPIIECPHCQKTGGESAMRKWHFNHCNKRVTQ